MERDDQGDLDFDLPLIKEVVGEYESHYRGGRLIRPSPRRRMTGGFDGEGAPSRGQSPGGGPRPAAVAAAAAVVPEVVPAAPEGAAVPDDPAVTAGGFNKRKRPAATQGAAEDDEGVERFRRRHPELRVGLKPANAKLLLSALMPHTSRLI